MNTPTEPSSDPQQPKRLLRVVAVGFSMILAAAFVLFSAAAILLPSTKSSRIAWPDRQSAAPVPDAASTQPSPP